MNRLTGLGQRVSRRLLETAAGFERRVISSFPSLFGRGNVQVTFTYQVDYIRDNRDRYTDPREIAGTLTLPASDRIQYIRQITQQLNLTLSSDSQIVTPQNIRIISVINDPNRGFLSQYTRMQNFVFKLDGEEEHHFDSKKKNCVTDFLNYYYKDYIEKGKLPKDCLKFEWLDFCFEAGWQDEGICAIELKNWCMTTNLKMICVDKNDNIISLYTPDKVSISKPLVFRMHNNHIYPHPNPNGLVKKLAGNTGLKGKKPKEKKYEVEIIEAVNSYEFLFDKMIEEETEVLDKNIEFDKNNISSFKLGEKQYIYKTRKNEDMIEHFNKNNLDYTGQKVSDLVKDTLILQNIEKSKPNSTVSDILNQKEIKNRVHLSSTINEVNSKNIEDLYIYDIKNCHYNILSDPEEPWFFLDYKDNFEPYEISPTLKNGFYYVDTEDHSLLFGSNIYSSSIVRKALAEQIISHNNIKSYLKPSRTRSSSYFSNVLKTYEDTTDGTLLKKLYCTTSGLLGKNFNNVKHSQLTTCIDTAFEYVHKNIDKNCFVTAHDHKDYRFYFYGHQTKKYIEENNLPLYIQILDQQAIKLYDLQKQLNGTLVFRRVDCVGVKDMKGSPPKWVKNEKPKFKKLEKVHLVNKNYEDIKIIPAITTNEWKKDENINYSYDYEKLYDYVEQKKSIRIEGRAGFGKSYMIKKLMEKYEDEVLTLAYSNKAALNIKGQTIHRAFCLDGIDYRINKNRIKKYINKIKLIIIDEHGMISGDLWGVIENAKKYINCSVFIFGDFGQLRPIDNGDYKLHPNVKKLCDYNYSILQYHDKCRCNLELEEFIKEVQEDSSKVNSLPIAKNNFNIAYLNKTCDRVNEEYMNAYEGPVYHEAYDIIQVTDFVKDISSYTPMRIYKGLPVIAIKSNKNLNFYNSQEFVVHEVIEDMITLIDEDKNKITFHLAVFYNYFNPAYCVTLHKLQGTTLNKPFTLHDINHPNFDERFMYTALSRAKSKNLIFLNEKKKTIEPAVIIEPEPQKIQSPVASIWSPIFRKFGF